jgi:hypothetical protein
MRIVRAAIKFKQLNSNRYSSNEYRIKYGWRHSEIFREMQKDGIEYDRSDYETGFITDERPIHFVTRQEAARIAYEAGQVPELKNTIYSEDLWSMDGELKCYTH